MKIFDLSMVVDCDCIDLWLVYAKVYDDDNSCKTYNIIGPILDFKDLSNRIAAKYEFYFPSIEKTYDELITVHNLNQSRGKNEFGVSYPLIVDFEKFDDKDASILF